MHRPRLHYESHVTGLDRNEIGALLVAAGLGPASDVLISLLAINELRVSEAIGADIEALVLERGHGTPTLLRKASKIVTIPWPAHRPRRRPGHRRTPRRPDLPTPRRAAPDRHAAGRIVSRVGISKPVSPHTRRHAFITAALDAGVPLRDMQEAASHADPRTHHARRTSVRARSISANSAARPTIAVTGPVSRYAARRVGSRPYRPTPASQPYRGHTSRHGTSLHGVSKRRARAGVTD